uniref:Uncharacterized protein n=1 Tax=Anguilla anguilla TaxID=7936 RepID=A0A0E9UNA9_ANGAN
MFHSRNVPTV